MTVYSEITENRIKTYFIMFFFVALISFFFYMIGKFVGDSSTFFLLGFSFSLLSAVGSYYYSDKIVLKISGAMPADKKKYFDFYTVAENMAIAAGIAMPRLYVIDDPAPNAFATGRDPAHAVVAATTGLLNKLERAELEGVIAHEMSHIRNSDILVMTVVSVLAGMIVYVSDWVSRGIFYSRGDNNREGNALGLLIFIILLILTPIIATLIQLAVSRRREYLADASGALLNRNPDALANALIKISHDPAILKTASNATAHMYIENPFRVKSKSINWFTNLFSTHPPVDERVKILREM